MRISVIVTPEEYARIKEMAGLVPLSAWFRDRALGPRQPVYKSSIVEYDPTKESPTQALARAEHDKTCQCGICDFRRKNLK